MYVVEGWKLRMWLFLIPTTHMHTCTPSRHQQWLPNSQAPECRALVIIVKVKDEAEPHIRVDKVLKSQFSTMQEL